MGQSCLLSFIGVMGIILCHFCTSPNTKISATISRTLKNRIIYVFQQYLNWIFHKPVKWSPSWEEFITGLKITWEMHVYFFSIFFLPLTDFFFFLPIHTFPHLEKKTDVMSHSSILTISFVWEWFFLLLFSFIPLMNIREDSQNDDYFYPVFTIKFRMRI